MLKYICICSTASTEAVIAETGPIFSMPPASSSSTLEKIIRRILVLASAAVLYSSRPFPICAQNVNSATTSAPRMALPADDSASCGSNRLPRNPAMISASAVVPTSVRKLTPAIARIQSQRPRARRSSVLFMKSMFCFPSTFSYFLSICGANSGAGIVPAPLLPQRIYLLVYPFSPDAAISNALC